MCEINMQTIGKQWEQEASGATSPSWLFCVTKPWKTRNVNEGSGNYWEHEHGRICVLLVWKASQVQ